MLFSPQIPLPLEARRESRFEDFIAGPNETTLAAVRRVLGEPGATLFLYGPESSGKTHLLTALCHATREAGRTAFYAGLKSLPPEGYATLDGLEDLDLVCLDDLQAVAGDAAWETALFHFINRLREAGGSLVVASRKRLSVLPLGLPDLASRLSWGLRLQLEPLGERDRDEVLRQHAAALGIELPEEVLGYLRERGHRSLAGMLATVDRLQHAAFTAKRRITVPLAREVLKKS
jgi:DnaA family protein